MSERNDKREEGYYHVKYRNEWIVAEWVSIFPIGFRWILTNNLAHFYDSDFAEIDERRIERKEAKPKGKKEVKIYKLILKPITRGISIHAEDKSLNFDRYNGIQNKIYALGWVHSIGPDGYLLDISLSSTDPTDEQIRQVKDIINKSRNFTL